MKSYKKIELLSMDSARLNQIAACIFYGEGRGADGPLIVRSNDVTPYVSVSVGGEVIDSKYGPACSDRDALELINDMPYHGHSFFRLAIVASDLGGRDVAIPRTDNFNRDITILYILAKQAEA